MQRGAATQGKVAKSVAGAEAIEFKATIADHQIDGALKRFKLSTSNDEERFIYFYDTPQLDLLGLGIITRARRVIGDVHDSTVKFRPVEPDKVAARWRKYRDFKIEADASETGTVRSASFSMPVAKGVIRRVAESKKGIAALFTEEQEEFLMEMAARKIDFKSLAVLGPLSAQRWRFDTPECPLPITAELWTREDGARLMEVSVKAPVAQAAFVMGGFMALLAEVGAEHDDQQQSKTRWALDYYVAKLGGKATNPAGARPAPRQEPALARVSKPVAKPAARKAAPPVVRRRAAAKAPARATAKAAPRRTA